MVGVPVFRVNVVLQWEELSVDCKEHIPDKIENMNERYIEEGQVHEGVSCRVRQDMENGGIVRVG